LAEGGRIVKEVATAVGLAEGEPGVRAVIAALARLEPVSIRRISRAVELPVPIVASVCGELRKRAVVAEERPAQLTSAGRQLFAAGQLGLRGSAACPTCAGRGTMVSGVLSPVAADLAKAAARAPRPRLELDQCHCTVGTKLRRVLALDEADALVGRRILLLGDDDLVSLAICAVVRRFGSEATVAHLGVLDVDSRLIDFLRAELEDAPFPATCLRHDLREPLPAEMVRAFDTVVTDPPYTVSAAGLFLSRAAEALDGAGSVFLSFGSRRPGATFELQRAVGEMGFAVRSLVPDFNHYVGAGALGGTSQLYHLAATNQLRPVVTGTFAGPIYTASVSSSSRPSAAATS
jgi:N4-bis(aminopropyl)spermidine synthase